MMMQRILVIGPGGAGKSTFSRQLGALLGIEVVHLDTYFWNPGWIETPRDRWHAVVARLIGSDRWIMDGNYSGTLGMRLAACDTVVFLDVPRLRCLWRVFKRRFKYAGTARPDMRAGCPERLTVAFLRWIWQYPRRSKPQIEALLRVQGAKSRVFVLRSQREIEQFLARAGG